MSLEKMLGIDTPAFGAKGKQFNLEPAKSKESTLKDDS